EQASALQQVNAAISQMDRTTQENAARVEETTAAANELSTETERLQRLIETFRVVGGDAAGNFAQNAPAQRSERSAA
ncbi:MAG: chemotaxis protein, partial [Bradyrhizobium sp.]